MYAYMIYICVCLINIYICVCVSSFVCALRACGDSHLNLGASRNSQPKADRQSGVLGFGVA